MPKKAPDLSHIAKDLRPLAVPVELIAFDPDNARKGHDIDGIAKSILQFGQRKPVVVNRSEGNILLAGNGTYAAITQVLHATHIAAVFVEDDRNSSRGYAIADNRLGDLSYFDPDTLLAELANQDNIPGGDSLYEIIREVKDEVIDVSDISELVKGDSNLDVVPVTFVMESPLYELYLDIKEKIGNKRTDEEVLEVILLQVKELLR